MCNACAEDHLPKMRHYLFRDVMLGYEDETHIDSLTDREPVQVLLCRPYDSDSPFDYKPFAEMLHITGYTEYETEILPLENMIAFILRGNSTISKFHDFIQGESFEDYMREKNLHWSIPLFATCGRVVGSPRLLRQSYLDAQMLMQQRFFCNSNQFFLSYADRIHRDDQPSVLTVLLLEKYKDRLLQCIQAFNRVYTAKTLQELQEIVLQGNESPDQIRLFFIDLYLQIEEQMRFLYQNNSIPFYTNTYIIQTIQSATYLNDIISFLTRRFDMIMSSIGAFSRESILEDILHYIHHNFTSNITLENMAPLFGYNHSYLGKIFRKKVGYSFNEYIDRLRIDRAKELLLKDNAKVYAISEQVGYKNVDYFHVKFRKYVSMSPVEFRKINAGKEKEDNNS